MLELLRWTQQHFAAQGIDSARLDAECLLAFALGVERLQLYLDFEKPIVPEERARFRELVLRRARDRVPVSQLVGRKEFWSLSLKITADVLTPRPDTETLVAAALDRLPDREAAYRILDLGTGSGAIALALAAERPKAILTATDVSHAALQIARENAEELHVTDRVRFLEGSLFAPVAGEQFDAVVSNPPYVGRVAEGSLPRELEHEPAVALFAGDHGMAVLHPLVAAVHEVLTPGGWVLLELDPSQAESVSSDLVTAGLRDVEVARDLSGRPRVVAARRSVEERTDR